MLKNNHKYPARVCETNELFVATIEFEEIRTADLEVVSTKLIVFADRRLIPYAMFSDIEIYENDIIHKYRMYMGDIGIKLIEA